MCRPITNTNDNLPAPNEKLAASSKMNSALKIMSKSSSGGHFEFCRKNIQCVMFDSVTKIGNIASC